MERFFDYWLDIHLEMVLYSDVVVARKKVKRSMDLY
jgi:hypothetical protein